ncbi:hypothetical protein [Frankia sp. Cas3]|uniref:hypothetical protein n=1 Tax=Frankia sp. Cas3 TaxID=3073926 RepID=UPI002AD28C0E|nr:hypothetical protein [Frankia sp. Cas3]
MKHCVEPSGVNATTSDGRKAASTCGECVITAQLAERLRFVQPRLVVGQGGARYLRVAGEVDLTEQRPRSAGPSGAQLVVGGAASGQIRPTERTEGLIVVFDGGRLTSADAAGIQLPAEELADWTFAAIDQLPALMAPLFARRVAACLAARAVGRSDRLPGGRHTAGLTAQQRAAQGVRDGSHERPHGCDHFDLSRKVDHDVWRPLSRPIDHRVGRQPSHAES